MPRSLALACRRASLPRAGSAFSSADFALPRHRIGSPPRDLRTCPEGARAPKTRRFRAANALFEALPRFARDRAHHPSRWARSSERGASSAQASRRRSVLAERHSRHATRPRSRRQHSMRKSPRKTSCQHSPGPCAKAAREAQAARGEGSGALIRVECGVDRSHFQRRNRLRGVSHVPRVPAPSTGCAVTACAPARSPAVDRARMRRRHERRPGELEARANDGTSRGRGPPRHRPAAIGPISPGFAEATFQRATERCVHGGQERAISSALLAARAAHWTKGIRAHRPRVPTSWRTWRRGGRWPIGGARTWAGSFSPRVRWTMEPRIDAGTQVAPSAPRSET